MIFTETNKAFFWKGERPILMEEKVAGTICCASRDSLNKKSQELNFTKIRKSKCRENLKLRNAGSKENLIEIFLVQPGKIVR